MSGADQQQHANIGGRRIRCQGCQSRCRVNIPQCERPEGFGCLGCKRRGLVCIVGNTAYAPNPEPTEPAICPPCDPCMQNNRRCDFARPCQSCDDVGDECVGRRTNCFWRGVHSTDFYGYFLNLGCGPTGINDPDAIANWQQPANYHLEYVDSPQNAQHRHNLQDAQHGHNPQNAQHPGVVAYNPNRELYQEVINTANAAIQRGITLNTHAIYERLTADYNSLIPVSESQACQDLRTFIENRLNQQNQERVPERPIEYPEGTDFDLLRFLNPGRKFQGHVAPLLNTTGTPLDRPVSPGPARPQYHLPVGTPEESLDVVANDGEYPPDHPELVDMTKLQRPLASHPFTAGLSPLASIPYKRMWDNGEMYLRSQYCHTISQWPTTSVCTNPTRAGCEDNSHYGEGYPICDHCEVQCRDRFMEHFQSMIMSLRAYACAECTGDRNFVGRFKNSGFNIWWAFGQFPYTEAPSIDPTDICFLTAGGHKVGGWRGRPLDITGCACALKLFGRRICSPHRLQYMLKMDEAARQMREYVAGLYGKMVCPFCCRNAGVDAYDFEGARGREGKSKAYVCLSCHGVVLDNRTRTGPYPIIFLNSPVAAPPFNPDSEEINARVYKNPPGVEGALLNAFANIGAASGST